MNDMTILAFVNEKLNLVCKTTAQVCFCFISTWNFRSLPTILGSLQKKNMQAKCERTL
jgi:hypothetical protein